MADKSAIEWTDATWNPIVGCSLASPGCTNCYAMKMAARLEAMNQPIYQGLTQKSKAGAVWTGKVEMSNWGQVIKPLSWKRPRMIFVNSMSDLFHESLPDEAIDAVFAVMALAPQHTYQVLTKRAKRMQAYVSALMSGQRNLSDTAVYRMGEGLGAVLLIRQAIENRFPHVWLGVSAEDHTRADERIPYLLQTPAAVRWVSAEPLLGPINFQRISLGISEAEFYGHPSVKRAEFTLNALKGAPMTGIPGLDWIVVGGESGPNARPMHPDWARSIRDQCKAAGIPFFFKQWGEFKPVKLTEPHHGCVRRSDGFFASYGDPGFGGEYLAPVIRAGKKAAGRVLDGCIHDETPLPPF